MKSDPNDMSLARENKTTSLEVFYIKDKICHEEERDENLIENDEIDKDKSSLLSKTSKKNSNPLS